MRMKICVLQSLYPKGDNLQQEDPGSRPELFTEQHSFEHRWITKHGAKEAIDRALEENFDAYFSFLWGQYEDDVAGIEAVEHLESRLPCFVGMSSKVLKATKSSFYAKARERGEPLVPGDDLSRFPVFVKPSSRCASMFINEESKCDTLEELAGTLAKLDAILEPARCRRPDRIVYDTRNGVRIPSDITISQFVPGHDYSIVVVELGDTPQPLCPERYCYPPSMAANSNIFLTMDLKFNDETRLEMMQRSEDESLYDRMQAAAIEAFHSAGMKGITWCNVDMRVEASTGQVVVIEVNPMPAIFLPPGAHQWEDLAVRHAWPGGHVFLINNALATLRLRQKDQWSYRATIDGVKETYNRFSEVYDIALTNIPGATEIIGEAISSFDFDGSILDCCCGTGYFGKLLLQARQPPYPYICGIDLSTNMLEYAKATQAYGSIANRTLQHVLPRAHLVFRQRFEHIICFFSLQFFDKLDFAMVLSAMFFQAQRSVTITIDEIPESYNEALRERGEPYMVQVNHLSVMQQFTPPSGWNLVYRRRFFAWSSPTTGHKVFSTMFRWENIATSKYRSL